MQTRCRRSDRTFVFGEDTLEALEVFRLRRTAHEARDRRFAEGIELFFKFVVVAVVEEAQRASAAGGVVNHLGHDGVVFSKIKFVSDTDFACRVNQHVPEAQFLVEFAQQEHLDAGAGFFLVAVEAGRKHLGEQVLKHSVFNFTRFAVKHHHTALVAVRRRILCNFILWKFKLKLG